MDILTILLIQTIIFLLLQITTDAAIISEPLASESPARPAAMSAGISGPGLMNYTLHYLDEHISYPLEKPPVSITAAFLLLR